MDIMLFKYKIKKILFCIFIQRASKSLKQTSTFNLMVFYLRNLKWHPINDIRVKQTRLKIDNVNKQRQLETTTKDWKWQSLLCVGLCEKHSS